MRMVAQVVGSSLICHLSSLGWQIHTLPGEPVLLKKDGIEIDAFGVLEALKTGKMSAAAWQSLCTQAGIAALDLGNPPLPPLTTGQ